MLCFGKESLNFPLFSCYTLTAMRCRQDVESPCESIEGMVV